MERKFDNAKDVLYVVTYMEYPMKIFEWEKMPYDLDEEQDKSIPNNKRLELSLTRSVYREKNMNRIYGIVFGQCTPSLQSAMKGVLDYGKKPKDSNFLQLM